MDDCAVYLLATEQGKQARNSTRKQAMPADAWAVQFPVGKCSYPVDRGQVEQSGGTRQLPTRNHMLSQNRIDDTLLVREAQRGNRTAFEELVRHYDQAVLRLAMHLTGSQHEAQDIYQEAFLKAYKNIGRFRFECSFYTWIYRIVTNLCLDNIRKKQVRKEDAPVATDSEGEQFDLLAQVADGRSGANPERDLMRRELGKRISQALEKLTPRERMVFELKHYQGLKLRTVGEMLNTTEETAKNTLFRATQKLRGALAEMR
jgi:RNA polymerase sigma-70 factor (ECF subfamily)